MDVVGWIIIGLIAGSISGWIVGNRSVQGCLPTMVVGILGGLLGGWIAREARWGEPTGFLSALVVAVFGSVVVRLVLRALERD